MQLSVREAASLLGVSERKIEGWIKKRRLPANRVNDQYRINRLELLEWAIARNRAVSADLIHNGNGRGELLSLARALRDGGIVHCAGGNDKASLLHTILDAMQLPANVDRELLFQMLLARESRNSTALGDGIAIPHPRNPIVQHVERPIVCLCFLENPIHFGAIDGKPVHALFTFVSPTVRDHLQLLARLAVCLRDPGFKAAITRSANSGEILLEAGRVEAELNRGC